MSQKNTSDRCTEHFNWCPKRIHQIYVLNILIDVPNEYIKIYVLNILIDVPKEYIKRTEKEFDI